MTISDAMLLSAWERGLGRSLLERGLQLLTLARPQLDLAALECISIGERDRALLDLGQRLFGSWVQCVEQCPQCPEQVEIEFRLQDVTLNRRVSVGCVQATWSGQRLRWRLPNSRDLAAITTAPHAEHDADSLLNRCLLDVPADRLNQQHWPARLVALVSAKLAAADPQADVRVRLHCAACGNDWKKRFDIVSYLWSQLDAYAHRLIREVHDLASTYGWTEAEVLSLARRKRQLYLDLIRQ
jgi:hypothetical protein